MSSCSAAGMWRVRDLAGLGRDDLFSGLRYALCCITTTHKSIKQAQSIIVHGLFPANLLIPSFFSSHFTFSANLFGRGGLRKHAEEGRTSLSSASKRGLPLRLQAEPGRRGWVLAVRRWTAIFNRTALVGLWTEAANKRWGSMQETRMMWVEATKRWRKADVRWMRRGFVYFKLLQLSVFIFIIVHCDISLRCLVSVLIWNVSLFLECQIPQS